MGRWRARLVFRGRALAVRLTLAVCCRRWCDRLELVVLALRVVPADPVLVLARAAHLVLEGFARGVFGAPAVVGAPWRHGLVLRRRALCQGRTLSVGGLGRSTRLVLGVCARPERCALTVALTSRWRRLVLAIGAYSVRRALAIVIRARWYDLPLCGRAFAMILALPICCGGGCNGFELFRPALQQIGALAVADNAWRRGLELRRRALCHRSTPAIACQRRRTCLILCHAAACGAVTRAVTGRAVRRRCVTVVLAPLVHSRRLLIGFEKPALRLVGNGVAPHLCRMARPCRATHAQIGALAVRRGARCCGLELGALAFRQWCTLAVRGGSPRDRLVFGRRAHANRRARAVGASRRRRGLVLLAVRAAAYGVAFPVRRRGGRLRLELALAAHSQIRAHAVRDVGGRCRLVLRHCALLNG